jgi:hypothetical protein
MEEHLVKIGIGVGAAIVAWVVARKLGKKKAGDLFEGVALITAGLERITKDNIDQYLEKLRNLCLKYCGKARAERIKELLEKLSAEDDSADVEDRFNE